MENLLISVNLTKLNRVGRVLLDDHNGKKIDCIAIPIAYNQLIVSANNEVYLNMVAWASENLRDGQTHLVKPSVPKVIFEKMSEEQKRAIPIIGNVKPKEKKVELEIYSYSAQQQPVDDGKDLPFD